MLNGAIEVKSGVMTTKETFEVLNGYFNDKILIHDACLALFDKADEDGDAELITDDAETVLQLLKSKCFEGKKCYLSNWISRFEDMFLATEWSVFLVDEEQTSEVV